MAQSRRGPAAKFNSSPVFAIPPAFVARKQKILSELQRPNDEYTDKSPKGNVDVEIRDLINEINKLEGYVTTSSCAGRVAVFVEGGNAGDSSLAGDAGAKDESLLEVAAEAALDEDAPSEKRTTASSTRTSAGGKGGGHWLYVSHDPVPSSSTQNTQYSGEANSDISSDTNYFTKLFQLSTSPAAAPQETPPDSDRSEHAPTKIPRLVHLSFSPLILHIQCASLGHARPLLSAAINAGFRESGVQSLRVLNDPSSGVMVAIRTAGLAFETVVATVVEGTEAEGQQVQRIVSEDYLAMCVTVVNERFRWNDARRDRLRAEIQQFTHNQQSLGEWEDEDERRLRKRREGLLRQEQRQKNKQESASSAVEEVNYSDQDQGVLQDGLTALDIG